MELQADFNHVLEYVYSFTIVEVSYIHKDILFVLLSLGFEWLNCG